MKAAVMRELNDPLEIEEIQIETPQAGEVLVKTGFFGRIGIAEGRAAHSVISFDA